MLSFSILEKKNICLNCLILSSSGKWIFIRFNPDPYIDKRGNKRNPEMKTRLNELEKQINK